MMLLLGHRFAVFTCVYHQTSFPALTTDVSRHHVAEVSGVDKLVICDCDDPQENQGEAGSRTVEKYEKHIKNDQICQTCI